MKEKSDSFIFYSTAAGSERGGDMVVVFWWRVFSTYNTCKLKKRGMLYS